MRRLGSSAALPLADDIVALPGSCRCRWKPACLRSPASPPRGFSITQCLTDADARDPSRVLGGVSNPGASGCKYTDKSSSPATRLVRHACEGNFAIQGRRSRVSYTADTMNGVIREHCDRRGQPVQTQNIALGAASWQLLEASSLRSRFAARRGALGAELVLPPGPRASPSSTPLIPTVRIVMTAPPNTTLDLTELLSLKPEESVRSIVTRFQSKQAGAMARNADGSITLAPRRPRKAGQRPPGSRVGC